MKNLYGKAVNKRPYTTNMAQAAIFMAVGDVIAQLAQSENTLDLQRTAKIAVVGAPFGPFLVVYYRALERMSGSFKTQLKRNIVKVSLCSH